jgi:hypothetical protein
MPFSLYRASIPFTIEKRFKREGKVASKGMGRWPQKVTRDAKENRNALLLRFLRVFAAILLP